MSPDTSNAPAKMKITGKKGDERLISFPSRFQDRSYGCVQTPTAPAL